MNKTSFLILVSSLVFVLLGALVSCGESGGDGTGGVSFYGAGS